MELRSFMTAIAFAGCGVLFAQDSGFSAGIELAMPMGNTADAYSFGVGPALQYEREAGSSGLIGLSAAYTIMFAKADYIKGGSIVPLQGSYKYFFGGDVREGLYAGAMVGYGFQTMVMKDTPGMDGGSESNTGFAVAPLVGYWVTERIDLGLRYQIVATSSSNDGTISSRETSTSFPYIALRATFAF